MRRLTRPGMPSVGLRTTRSVAVIVVRSENLGSRVAVAEAEAEAEAEVAVSVVVVVVEAGDLAARSSRRSVTPVA